MLSLKIKMQDIKHHFDYLGWLYILTPILLIFFWSLVYTLTAYRAPDDKVLSFYMIGPYASYEQIDLLEEEIAPLFPEMEEMDFMEVMLENVNDYQNMQRMTTYIYAQQGDVYIMDTELFDIYVGQGLFMPLDGLIDTDIDLAPAMRSTEDDPEVRLYGIPADDLYGFYENEYYDNRRSMLVVMAFTTNPDESVQLIEWFLENRAADAPEGIEQWPEKAPMFPEDEMLLDDPF